MTRHSPEPFAGLSPEQLVELFPFHLVIDRELTVRQFGRSLGLVLPSLTAGAHIETVLSLKRPRGSWTLDRLRHGSDLLHIAEHAPTQMILRGQIVCLDAAADTFVFLASPWLEGPEELDRLGLALSDFAIHDVSLDLIQVAQSMRIANNDLRRLADVQRSHRAELQRANSDLERVRAERDMILELSPDGYLAFDQVGAVVYVNPAATRFLRFSSAEIATLTIAEVDARLTQLTGTSEALASSFALPDGSVDVLHFVNAPRLTLRRVVRAVLGPDQQPTGHVVYLRDVTKEHELDRMRSEFLATAAHELRTPMSSIHGFSELLMNREFDASTRREVVETIHSQSQFVVRMVNDLLDLERLSSATGRGDLRLIDFEVRPFVQDVVDGIMVEGDARTVDFIDEGFAPAYITADPDKLRQATLNVLSNAFRYSRSRGSPIVTSLRRRQSLQAREIGIAVEDQGVGMTPEQLAKAFDRFYRADPSTAVSGTGLGLTLVKEIMDRMGGAVEIHSVPNVGTTVVLWLPEAETAYGCGDSPARK